MPGALPRPAQRTPSQPSKERNSLFHGGYTHAGSTGLRPPGGEGFSPNVIRPEITDMGDPNRTAQPDPYSRPTVSKTRTVHRSPRGPWKAGIARHLRRACYKDRHQEN